MNSLFTAKNTQRAGWILALGMTAAALLLHFYSFSVVGGLWRDEVGLPNIALLPAWKDVMWGLMHDHCPVVFPAVLRVWAALGLAGSDDGLRLLGLCVGLFLLMCFWATARMMGQGLPMLALALAALNPVVIRYGDSIRGYGLGTCFMVLTVGLVWRFVKKPGWFWGLSAGLSAVVSVQTLYQNAFFLVAICAAGMIVSLRQHQMRKAAGILTIGFVAALSLLPYVKPIHDAQSWWMVESQSHLNPAILIHNLFDLLDNLFIVWMAVVVLAAGFGLRRFIFKAGTDGKDVEPELPLFAGIALVLGVAGFILFLKLSGLPTQVWYYIQLLCFTMICCDAILPRVYSATAIVVLIIALFCLTVSPSAYPALSWRQTNGDLLAAKLAKEADPQDLIVVTPWFFGMTFDRYYHGAAKWTTVPPITDHRFHRYDLIKEQIQMTNAIALVLDKVEAALRSGHRVWVVGQIPRHSPDMLPPVDLPVAPNGPSGWWDVPYSTAWEKKLGFFLQHHASKIAVLDKSLTYLIPIDPREKMGLMVAGGWQTDSSSNFPEQ